MPFTASYRTGTGKGHRATVLNVDLTRGRTTSGPVFQRTALDNLPR